MNITLENVNYIYNPDTAYSKQALFDVSLNISKPEFICIAGGTGSGKSTLVQLLNGLKLPASGKILYDGQDIGNDKKKLRDIRCRIGLVFQYPEYQLFEETLIKDVAFGPKNKGLTQEEAYKKAKEALLRVGMDETDYDKSPFDLSGGEKRRVAIAGILAMEPEVLILDEPTAGLDPAGKKLILDYIRKYQTEKNITVIMISHNMDEVAQYGDRVIVMKSGKIIMDLEPHALFADEEMLKDTELEMPQAASFARKAGIKNAIKVEEVVEAICSEILH